MQDISSHVSRWRSNTERMKIDLRSRDEWVVTFSFEAQDIQDKNDRIVIQRPEEAYVSFRKDAVRKAEEHQDGTDRLYFASGPDVFIEVHPTVSALKS